jgi:chaperone required for assembly of F1-ATPase
MLHCNKTCAAEWEICTLGQQYFCQGRRGRPSEEFARFCIVASIAATAHVRRMGDLFGAASAPDQPTEPHEAARRTMRQPLPLRLYDRARVVPDADGFSVALDGRIAKTPAGHPLAAPARTLAERLAGEWEAQQVVIDASQMPLTRLANTIIDGVTRASGEVAAEVGNYLACDLVLYRADHPNGLIERQAAAWDPVLEWSQAALGARFTVAHGMIHVAQSREALCAARGAIPRAPWPLGALHAITTLTGSALIALALAGEGMSLTQAWLAANVDEDWNMEQWGRDALALDRSARRFADMQAAVEVLCAVRDGTAL